MAVARKTERMLETSRGAVETPSKEKVIQLQEDARQRIAEKAYALYERRGKREGYALQDWLDAEYFVNEEIYEAH